ncbi:MAG: hypothetical protein COU33_02920 [Candidatus Magasanikbacteria bacterium CG10_big_fil_rev_8_21_14_0_10_43_6]|uniref:Uncharacterized protein n=1 Tax=Candidatus Magasanikbacteria bacterium CG10_big_fil_rev_8_21_14_0_10_43_6 TaxID=1974650 RepID=A0A2M6W0Z5_9BACT|nr:MAG: hypothetical protein COU33_02920 [Candidatus Magasanikbacteria bacterium CG10_big_fil_rev_8_21_14_0_10_43_6]
MSLHKHIRIFIFSIAFVVLLFGAANTFAKDLKVGDAQGFLNEAVAPTGISQSDISSGAGVLVKRVLAAVGIIFFGLMVYAGFLWMTARGEEDQITKARNTIVGAIIGLIVTVGAYGITAILVTRLQQGASGGGNPNNKTAQGCCQDRVNAIWACRITTESDCTERGLVCEPGDDFCSPSDFNFNENIVEIPACVATCDEKNQ